MLSLMEIPDEISTPPQQLKKWGFWTAGVHHQINWNKTADTVSNQFSSAAQKRKNVKPWSEYRVGIQQEYLLYVDLNY